MWVRAGSGQIENGFGRRAGLRRSQEIRHVDVGVEGNARAD